MLWYRAWLTTWTSLLIVNIDPIMITSWGCWWWWAPVVIAAMQVVIVSIMMNTLHEIVISVMATVWMRSWVMMAFYIIIINYQSFPNTWPTNLYKMIIPPLLLLINIHYPSRLIYMSWYWRPCYRPMIMYLTIWG